MCVCLLVFLGSDFIMWIFFMFSIFQSPNMCLLIPNTYCDMFIFLFLMGSTLKHNRQFQLFHIVK